MGKTFLANYLAKQFARKVPDLQMVFIDPKFERRAFGDGETIDKPKLVTKYNPKIRFQCFQSYNWTSELEDMTMQIMKRGTAIVDLDELGGLATAQVVPDGITRLATQGRGKGVGLWSKYQKPLGVPKVLKSQSEYFFLFRLTPHEDRREMMNYIPDEAILERIPKFYYWLYHDEMENAILVKPIDIKGTK